MDLGGHVSRDSDSRDRLTVDVHGASGDPGPADLIRISNVASRRHFYSRYGAFNSDSTKLAQFQFTGGAGRMINGTTYADIGSFAFLSNFVMANTDPNKGYGVDGGGANILYTQNLTTAGLTTKHTFASGYTVWIGGDSGSWEGGISDDDRYLCLTLTDVGHGGGDRLITYDTVGDTIIGNIAKPASMDNAQVSRLGNYVVVVAGGTTRRYTLDLTSSILLVAHGNHGDNALDLFGNEIFVTNNAPGVVSYLLSSGASRMLLSPGSAFEYGHTSGRGPNGWVYLSVYDTITTAGRLGFDQIVGLKTDGSGDVVVFGFANHNNNGSVYASQPHATPSRDGTRVVVASEWGATNVYDYVFSL